MLFNSGQLHGEAVAGLGINVRIAIPLLRKKRTKRKERKGKEVKEIVDLVFVLIDFSLMF